MRFVTILLAIATIALASYTVDKASIKVGYCTGDAGEAAALLAILNDLGFGSYQSSLFTAADFTSHGCQIVFNYIGSTAVTGWSAEMTGAGRGYVQCANSGWQYFACSRSTLDPGSFVNVGSVTQGHELTTFPNTIPASWTNTHGMASYSHPNQDYIATCTDGTLTPLGTTNSGTTNCPNALTVKANGAGRGVWYAWCNYGGIALAVDKQLTENAIIYAAQPPKANAGGPYNGYVDNPVTLDGSASTDNVSIALYEWDINNDGTYELSGTTPTTQYTWTGTYDGTIVLRCTDNIGSRSTSTAHATILGNTKVREDSLGSVRAEYH